MDNGENLGTAQEQQQGGEHLNKDESGNTFKGLKDGFQKVKTVFSNYALQNPDSLFYVVVSSIGVLLLAYLFRKK